MWDFASIFAPSKNPITKLWKKDKDAWCRRYFPQFAEVFGGYPKPLKITYGRISRTTTPVEMRPWEWPEQEFRPNGTKFRATGGTAKNGRPLGVWEDATEAEFVDWCDRINYFLNGGLSPSGGPGLNPGVFIGAVDYRNRAWFERRKASKETTKRNKLRSRQGLPLIPVLSAAHITCTSGRYYYSQGPGPSNPWGVNAFFIPYGAKEPSYIQQWWGPDYRPDVTYLGHVQWDEEADGPKPSQAEYNKARWMQRI